MSQSSSDKYLYFTVGLLKGSAALDALREDALKHHMIDQPGQLIALRLTEYYEMMSRAVVQPVMRVPAVVPPTKIEGAEGKEQIPAAAKPEPSQFPASASHSPKHSVLDGGSNSFLSQITGRMRSVRREGEGVIFTSPDADQNADEAADYWSTL